MAAKPGILCFSSTDWEGWWGSRQQVMSRLARRGYRVLYVEQMAGLEHLWRYPELRQRKFRRWKEGLHQVQENLWIISPPPLLPGRYYARSINKTNIRLVKNLVKQQIHVLKFPAPVLWFYKPEHVDLLNNFNAQLSVYHCIDEWAAGTSGRKRQQITTMDNELVSKADLVFANSPLTFEKKVHLNPNTYRLPSGVNFNHFSQGILPEFPNHPAMASIPAPRIGYSGTINNRLDYEVLEQIADAHPEWSLVFVGDPYPWTMQASQIRRLARYPNVYFPGKFSFQEMPAILKSMDVCLLPYIDDERGQFRSPLKLYEYLAAGKPVVSLVHPEASEFAAYIYIADSSDAFIQAVSRAMNENSPELIQSRLEVARKHSWDRRVDTIETALKLTLGTSKKRILPKFVLRIS